MSFALPIALTLAALALPIIAFYIMKVRLRRVPVSTNLFWKQIYEEKPPRSLWQHFRHLISLLLQLVLLLLIVLAIADPYFPGQLLQARRLVIVVDNSASMRATDVAPSRLEAVQKAGLEIVDGLRFYDQVAVVLAGSIPEVIIGMTGHTPTLRDAISGIPFSDNPTSLGTAIELGRQLIGQHPHGQIIVMTDGAVDSSELAATQLESTDGKSPVEFRLFSTDAANIGITQLQVRRSFIDPLGYEILVCVKNASTAAVACRLELFLNDIPVDVIPLKLKPEEFWSRSIEKTSLDGGRLHGVLTEITAGDADRADGVVDGIDEVAAQLAGVAGVAAQRGPRQAGSVTPVGFRNVRTTGGSLRSTPATATPATTNSATTNSATQTAASRAIAHGTGADCDLLLADNSAWALLPARKVQRVLLITAGNLFLQKVFEANPFVELTILKVFPETWPMDSIIVLHGMVPAMLPPGDVFVVDPTGSCDQWTQGELIENPLVTEQDTTSPLMNHIRLDNVLIPEARQLVFERPPHALAKTVSDELIYAEVKRPGGRCLVLSVNLDRSDLAFRTVFPIMVANSLGWFAGSTGELQPSLPTGTVTTLLVRNDFYTASGDVILESPTMKNTRISITAQESPAVVSELISANTSSSDLSGSGGQAPADGTKTVSPFQSENGIRNAAENAAIDPSRRCTIGPLDEVGVWLLARQYSGELDLNADADAQAQVLAEVAVNLANERETDLRPLPKLLDSPQTRTISTAWFSRPLWFYLIVVACVLTSVEWFLYQRRIIS